MHFYVDGWMAAHPYEDIDALLVGFCTHYGTTTGHTITCFCLDQSGRPILLEDHFEKWRDVQSLLMRAIKAMSQSDASPIEAFLNASPEFS